MKSATARTPSGRVMKMGPLSRSQESSIGISTHDRDLIAESRRLLSLAGRTRADYELQTLLGVDAQLETELLEAGEPLRVYVPYGEDWYPYVSRRSAKVGKQ